MKAIFGPYLPDLPAHLSPGLKDISNLYPGANGYKPVGAYEQIYTALPDRCRGASSFTSPGGKSIIIAGTATSLYRANAGAFEEIANGFSLQDDGRWRFCQFGGLAIATDQVDAMRKIDIESGEIAVLGGAPPKIQTLAVVQNFLVGGIVDGDVSRMCWSAENNAEGWSFGTNKADYNIFPDGGAITGILGGEFGIVLQRNAVRRMSYVGGNVLFQLDKIASNVGCTTVHSVAQFGELGFWYSDSGFKMWDGAQIQSIGFEQVDATFAKLYNITHWPTMSAAVDGVRNTVIWSMDDKHWIYNWLLKKWSVLDVSSEIVFNGVTKTITVDEQDLSVGAPDDNIDTPGLDSFDDPRFKGGDPRFYLFADDHSLGILSGDNLAASVTTGDVELLEGRDVRLRKVRPMSDVVGGVTLTTVSRQRLGDAGETKVFTSLRPSGEMPVRARGRFTRAKFEIAAAQDWTYLQGLDWKGAEGGGR